MKKNKAFTLIELIAVLVILAIISLIVAPLILNIIRRVKDVANKRSVDGYGRAVEYAMASYQLEHLKYPDSFEELEIEYTGSKVECETSRINSDYTIYLSKCKVNGKIVNDTKNKDGYYHYGTLKMTNQEYVNAYGKNLEDALKKYHDEHGEYPSDYTILTLEELDKEVSCDFEVYNTGKIYLTKCYVGSEEVLNENEEDGCYHYGQKVYLATEWLVKNANGIEITNYSSGNTHEMYTFSHGVTSQTGALTDYRYIGNEPHNYVTFNGDETWRIIGVFTVDDGNGKLEQSIKIVRNTKLDSNMKWSSYYNDWPSVTLNTYLNGQYYNSLNSDAKNMIASTKYYLGGRHFDTTLHFGTTPEMYSWERGTTVYSGNSVNWTGKIALMYPSDYTYTYALGVDNTCFSDGYECGNSLGKINSWIYNTSSSSSHWYLSAGSNSNREVFYTRANGLLETQGGSMASCAVRPTLFLNSKARIKSGDGSIDSPYEFEL